VRSKKEQFFKLLRPLAGHAHRASQTQNSAENRFGGAWLPPPSDAPDMSAGEFHDLALELSAPAIRKWVEECRKRNPQIRRGDKCPVPFKIPPEDLTNYETVGIYKRKDRNPVEFQLAYAVPLQVDIFDKLRWQQQKLHAVKHLFEVYQVLQWRQKPQAEMFQPHAELRPDLVFLAKLRYQDFHEQLTPEQQSWPMSPLMITFVQHGLRRGVGREALILACLLETEAVTFIPEAVAGAWATSK
jgi:hypothetical protein